jgi:hypothetical protein
MDGWMENLSDREKKTFIKLLTKLRSGIPTSQKRKK